MKKTITMRHSVIIPLTILLCWAFFPDTAHAQQKKTEILKPAISVKSYKENLMLGCKDPDAGVNETFKGSTAYFGKLPVSDHCLDQRFLMEAKCGLSDKNKYQQKIDCFTEGPKLGAKLSSVCVSDHCEVMSDKDGDGVPDSYDNCPDKANAEQADSNSDGIGNACPSLKPSITGELLATISLPSCDTPKDMFFSEFTPSVIYGFCGGEFLFNNEKSDLKKDFYIFKIDTSVFPAKITSKKFDGDWDYGIYELVEISPGMFVQRLDNEIIGGGGINNKFVITSFKSKKITEYQLPDLDVSSLSAKDSNGKTLKKLSPNYIKKFSYDSVDQKLYILTWNSQSTCKIPNDCVLQPATLLKYSVDAASGNPPELEGFILVDYNPETMFFIDSPNGAKKLFVMSYDPFNKPKTTLTVVDLDKWEITATVPSSNEIVYKTLFYGNGFVVTSPASNKIIFAEGNSFAVFDSTYKLISSQDISYEKWWEDTFKPTNKYNVAPFIISRIAVDTKDRLYLTTDEVPFTRVADLKSTLPYIYPYTLYAPIPNSNPPVWPTSESELDSMFPGFETTNSQPNNGVLIQGNMMIQVWKKYLIKFFIP